MRSDDRNDSTKLRKQRDLLDLTQKNVAVRAGIPLQSYQKFENGSRQIRRASFELACRVLEALEMDIPAFYHDEKQK